MRQKWTDSDIQEWTRIHTSNGYISLITMEQNLGVSHSTLWWCFRRRLPTINKNLYNKVTARLEIGTHKGSRTRND